MQGHLVGLCGPFLVYVALFAIHTYLHIATNSGLRRARVRLLGVSLPGLCTVRLPSEDAVARRRHRRWFSFFSHS
ncbi:hypothetical protein V8C43DRAFT_292720, partial [Trichoderma afarasin]